MLGIHMKMNAEGILLKKRSPTRRRHRRRDITITKGLLRLHDDYKLILKELEEKF